MFNRFFQWLKSRFIKPPERMHITVDAKTIPEAFGYPEPQYNILVKDLSQFIEPTDRVVSMDAYLKGPLWDRYKLDMNNPKHAAVFGYAFCSAVFIQRELMQNEAAKKVLDIFYPPAPDPLTVQQKVIN